MKSLRTSDLRLGEETPEPARKTVSLAHGGNRGIKRAQRWPNISGSPHWFRITFALGPAVIPHPVERPVPRNREAVTGLAESGWPAPWAPPSV